MYVLIMPTTLVCLLFSTTIPTSLFALFFIDNFFSYNNFAVLLKYLTDSYKLIVSYIMHTNQVFFLIYLDLSVC